MLSYRHAFHAGNHADVLKHFVLYRLLCHLNRKAQPWWFIDTHAGAGLYRLDQGYAVKNAEHENGIGRLWQRNDVPQALAGYLDLVRRINPNGVLCRYPGSPMVAFDCMRSDDRLRLFELHPADAGLLRENLRAAGRRAKVEQMDGFAGLKAVLPPPPRRGLILIDPPYEQKQDYRRVPLALQEAMKRFATGIYAVWYPWLARTECRTLPEALKRLPTKGWLHVGLAVRAPAVDGLGMYGSGMFILNPPWTLQPVLAEVMPFLTEALAHDGGARYLLEAYGG
jgi:23S rRNA (adenine2030-N6)-methyltransferase